MCVRTGIYALRTRATRRRGREVNYHNLSFYKSLAVAPLALRFLPEHDAHALAVAERAGCGAVFTTNHHGVDLPRDLERPEVRGPLLVDVRARLSGLALGEVLRAMTSRFLSGAHDA